MKRRILAIDGNYFAHRCLGQLNMGDKTNFLESKNEIENFKAALNVSIVNLWEAFKPFCSNIILTNDNESWRKTIEPFRPYFIPTESEQVIGYKEQRIEKKEESPINYNNFYQIYNEFVDSISSNIMTFNIKGLEGDDNLMLLSNKISTLPNMEMIVFCTDGDLNQIVKDNVILMRNIRSGDAPKGEFVITYKKYCEIFEKDAKSLLIGNTFDNSFYTSLFALNLFDKTPVTRKLNEGISIATPFKVALIKSICGDKKDNLFPLLQWKSSTGTKNFKITENHITAALKSMGYVVLTEKLCHDILTDKDFLINLLINIKAVTKQNFVDTNQMGKHLKHNLRMNVLAAKNVPEAYVADFDKVYSNYESVILNDNFDDSILKKLNTTIKDSAVNLFQDSIPNIDKILNQ